jgi:cell division protein FtsI/penicillin-binding protein 2
MTGSAKGRALIACSGLAILFSAFSIRLVHIQVFRHDYYAEQAAEKHVTRQIIPARRGSIRDVNGEVVAANEPLRTVVADGSLIPRDKVAFVAQQFAAALQLDAAELEKKITPDRRYVVIKREVSETIADKLRSVFVMTNRKGETKSIPGIACEQTSRRVYPNGPMLCHALGFTNSENAGVQGVESAMDQFLRGSEGFRFIERDLKGREIVLYRGQERSPHDGSNVRLTVDLNLQNIVESELDTAVKQYKPVGAVAILMRPQTGEILAIANRPCFDLNDLDAAKPEQMRNNAIISMVEPGSTFKIVTAAAAINEHEASLDSMIFCENGHFNYGGRTLHDHGHGYGELTVEDILAKSSNIGAAKLAMRLGDQRLYDYARRFGFGERTGVALPGEISGVIHPPHRWSKISITRIPMGQEVAATPLQIITAMSTIANGGRLMMPQIIKDVSDSDGNVLRSFDPVEVRRVVSEETSAKIRMALAKVVSTKGTAALAAVPGFTVAGKTGTAQKVDPKGGYAPGKYVVSFVGFMPAENPQFACLVMLDDARVSSEMNYGGTICAPVFRQIAEKTARYMNLEPDSSAVPGGPIPTQNKVEEDNDR